MPQRLSHVTSPAFRACLLLVLAVTCASGPVHAASRVIFHDLALEVHSGLTYHHAPSSLRLPMKMQGAPGVALLDYDRDGALDIFVTNGPGGGNKLYKNLLKQTGKLAFQDVAQQAGVALPDEDSTGVCYGDLNNDGYDDLLVLGVKGNHLFLNNGDGTFKDITAASGLAAANTPGSPAWSCAMGDVTGNGLLDIVITKNPATHAANELWLNQGNNTFVEAGKQAGIQNVEMVPMSGPLQLPSTSWAVALVDFDLDGKLDLITANDMPFGDLLTPHAMLNAYRNDGAGHFSNVTHAVGLDKPGFWMGLSFGDLDGNGTLDLFATNFGDYLPTLNTPTYQAGSLSSRPFLGTGNGKFTDGGIGNLGGTPFGWGTAMADFENDGHTDIVFHGGMDFGPVIESSNVGTLLLNDGNAHFTADTNAFVDAPARNRQDVQGLAVGNLANNGFQDIVWVSDFDIPAQSKRLKPYNVPFQSPFNAAAEYIQRKSPTDSVDLLDGSLSVEMNSADNGNGWAQVELVGSVGTLPDGKVNRDGIGAVVFFTPDGGKPAMRPILGGSSYASQDSLIASFGMGQAASGTVEVLWPGGARNRLYAVKSGERVAFPEIPCSFKAQWASQDAYQTCVQTALDKLVEANVLDAAASARFLDSALRAFTQGASAQ